MAHPSRWSLKPFLPILAFLALLAGVRGCGRGFGGGGSRSFQVDVGDNPDAQQCLGQLQSHRPTP